MTLDSCGAGSIHCLPAVINSLPPRRQSELLFSLMEEAVDFHSRREGLVLGVTFDIQVTRFPEKSEAFLVLFTQKALALLLISCLD